eukprot:15324018-Ditylum_brightwellii.AAC.1
MQGHECIVPNVSMKDETKVPPTFSVCPDFKDACVEFINNNIGNVSVATVHSESDDEDACHKC